MKIDAVNIMGKTQSAGEAVRGGRLTETDTQLRVFSIEKSRKADHMMAPPTYGKPEKGETTIEDIQEQASGKDAVLQKNEMLFAANTTSEKDAAGIEEEGYSLLDSDIHTIVTETDKIKAVLAKAGEDIRCFGDDLTPEQLAEIAGSAALAGQLEQALEQADLPATTENVEDMMKTISTLQEVVTPTDGTVKYMLDNQLEATPENLWKSQFSGSVARTTAEAGNEIDYESLQPAIEAMLEESGLELSEENIADSEWLIANDIPLTNENLERLQQLNELKMPIEPQKLVQTMIEGITEGVRPQNVNLASGNVKYTTQELDILTARRQREETRLAMTTEANISMLKKGVSVDTTELSELVEELKEREQTYQKRLSEQDGRNGIAEIDGVSGSRQEEAVRQTIDYVEEIKGMPAYALGMRPVAETTLEQLHDDGARLQERLEKANERYETMMTAPRADLGDSMKKAFQNVDDILTDLNMDVNRANQRAVRILAYNQMEITPESVTQMKAADEEVQRTFANLKPAVVETMIKRDINPLDLSLPELNEIAEELEQEQGIKEDEKFSKYLYKLEQNRQISEEERSAYIGIYRLIKQVEKTDGAAIGSLLQQGGEITLRNLLTQIRSGRHRGMDYTVDDDFGGVAAKEQATSSITDQIEAGYQTNLIHDISERMTPEKLLQIGTEEQWLSMTPEQLAGQLEQAEESVEYEYRYQREQLEDLAEAARAPEEIYELLEHYDIPVTVNHVMAAMQMRTQRNGLFRQIFGTENNSDLSEELREIQKKLLEDFGEAVKTPKEMAEAQERLADTAEKVMKTMINEKESVSSLDIRQMKVAMSEITLATAQSREETYAIPVLVQGEMCNVTLKIVRGEKQKGLVDIVFDTERFGKVAATLQATERGVTGFVSSDRAGTCRLFEGQESYLKSQLGLSEEQDLQLSYITSANLNLNDFGSEHRNDFQYGSSEEDAVQTKTLYRMAESFLSVVKSLENHADIDSIG
ncbi:MAG: hypothetical protein IJ567_09140 [Lachnospiraceae bacterium]|nr:hypothetical protein [Lachnospiraceae bacterium]